MPTVQDTEKLPLLLVGPASNYVLRVLNSMPVRVGKHGFSGSLVTYQLFVQLLVNMGQGCAGGIV